MANTRARVRRGLLAAIAAGLCFGVYGGTQGLRYEFHDELVRLTRQVPPAYESPVAVVGLDDEALRTLDAKSGSGLDRAGFARLVEAIAACRPRVLAVDVVFADRRDSAGDAALARALGAAGPALVAESLRFDPGQEEPALREPYPDIWAAGVSAGVTNVTPDADSTVRRLTLLFRYQGNDLPHLALEAARRYLGATGTHRVAGGVALKGGPAGTDRELPADPVTQELLIPYRGRDRFTVIPASRFLGPGGAGQELSRRLAGKLVLVGAAGSARGDLHTTPYGAGAGRLGHSPGVILLANVAEGIIVGDLLSPPAWSARVALLACSLAVAGPLFSLLSPLWGALALAGALLGLVVGSVACFAAGVVLETVRVGEALVLTYVLVLVLAARERREGEADGAVAASPGGRDERPGALRASDATAESAPAGSALAVGAPAAGRPWAILAPTSELAPAPILACIVAAGESGPVGPRWDWRVQAARMQDLGAVAAALARLGGWIEPRGPLRTAVLLGPGETPLAHAPAMLVALLDALDVAARSKGAPPLRAGLHLAPAVTGRPMEAIPWCVAAAGEAPWIADRLADVALEYEVPVLVTDTVVQRCAGPSVFFRPIDRIHGPGGVLGIHAPMRAGDAAADPMRQALAAHAQGLAEYQRMAWDRAKTSFYRVLDLVPGDGPARRMLLRIEAFRAEPPREGWGGAIDLAPAPAGDGPDGD